MKRNGRFENPWDTWHFPTFSTIMKWRLTETKNTNLPSDPKVQTNVLNFQINSLIEICIIIILQDFRSKFTSS